jgi:hypothetical protein
VIARQTMEDNRSYSINKLPLIQSTSCDKSRKRSKRTESSSSDLIDRSFRRRRILWISYIWYIYYESTKISKDQIYERSK